ncbi:hypothetical protein D3C71_78190 [compost metagenome]
MKARQLKLKHDWPRRGLRRKRVWKPVVMTYTETYSPAAMSFVGEWVGLFKEQNGPVKPRFLHPPGRKLTKAARRLMCADRREEQRSERRLAKRGWA